MANEKTMSDRQLLESMHATMSDRQLLESMCTNVAVHEAKHEVQDKLIIKMTSAIWGNGKVGLTSKVYLLTCALGAITTVVTGLIVALLKPL